MLYMKGEKKMAKNTRNTYKISWSKEQLKEAIIGSGGLKSFVLRKLNRILKDAGVHLKYLDKPDGRVYRTLDLSLEKFGLKDMFELEKQRVLDAAENNIIKAIEEGDLKTSQWYLQHKKNDRDYIDQQNINVQGNITQEIKIKIVDTEKEDGK